MKITYYGHSCFLMEIKGKNLLFDPFISPNELAAGVDINTIPADYILISHGHEDHVADAIAIAKRTGALVISNFEIIQWLANKEITNGHSMNIGGHWTFDFGKVKCINAVHSSSMPDGSYGGTAMGFLVETEEGNIYYSGDTALNYDMKLLGTYKRIDLSLLPIGGNYTMGVDNAIIAAEFVKCDKVIGMHYDTFGWIKIDHQEAIDKFNANGTELILMKIGSSLEFNFKSQAHG